MCHVKLGIYSGGLLEVMEIVYFLDNCQKNMQSPSILLVFVLCGLRDVAKVRKRDISRAKLYMILNIIIVIS